MTDQLSKDVQALTETISNLVQSHQVTDHLPALMPKPFTGDPTADTSTFMDRFLQYCAYAGIAGRDGKDKLKLIPLLLESRAASWYKELEAASLTSWDNFKSAFDTKYGPKAMGFLRETALLSRTQRETESVDSYSTDMLARLNLTETEKPAKWKAYVQGLLPSIKQYVLDIKEPTSLDQAETLARKAEQLQALTRNDTLDKAVVQLQALLLAQSTQAASQHQVAFSNPQSSNSDSHDLADVVRDLRVQVQALSSSTRLQPDGTSDQGRYRSSRTTDGRPRCEKCGGNHYTNSCRTPRVINPITCYFCQRQGHIISECRAKRRDTKAACSVCGNAGHSTSECRLQSHMMSQPTQPLTPAQPPTATPNPNAPVFNPHLLKN